MARSRVGHVPTWGMSAKDQITSSALDGEALLTARQPERLSGAALGRLENAEVIAAGLLMLDCNC